MMSWLEEGKFPGARKVGGATSPWVIPAEDVEAVRVERVADLKRQMARIARPVEEYRELYEVEVSLD